MTVWDDEALVEALKAMYLEGGYSAQQIATKLGHGLTRNAVIGKIHRLELHYQRPVSKRGASNESPRKRKAPPPAPPRPLTLKPHRMPVQFANPRPPIPPAEAEPVKPEPIYVPPAERKGVIDLEPGDCRWPIGDPQMADFHFCNRQAAPGQPYCTDHCLVAYRPPQGRPARGEFAQSQRTESRTPAEAKEDMDA